MVCTDVPYDGPATITATRHFLTQVTGSAGGLRFMAVPQGSTRPEWLACYEALTALPGVHSIGVSKLSVPRCWNAGIARARLACVAELHRHGPPPKPLHLLGGDGCLPAELRAHREHGHVGVRSSDSSAAFWYARLGIPLDPVSTVMPRPAPPKPDLETTRLTPAQLAAARASITMIREAAGLPSASPEGASHDTRPLHQGHHPGRRTASLARRPRREGYLRQPHRHLFTVCVRMQVRHSDREIEINAFAAG